MEFKIDYDSSRFAYSFIIFYNIIYKKLDKKDYKLVKK